MRKEIRITDLQQPQLSEPQIQVLRSLENLPLDFTVEGILAAACRKARLSDFGATDFMPRLALLVDEWSRDAEMTAACRFSLFHKLVQFATNRLLIEDTLKRHPEILEQKIERPLIVAGLPRSGTTHLLNLLAADSRARALPLWESYEPLPLPGEKPGKDGVDPRYARCAAAWKMMQQTVPLIEAMHPMEPDHIHEELELMGPDFASYNFEWLASMSPRWRDHYYASDQTPHYEYMKKVLKILQWQRGAQRWVLKCPQHLEQLPVLHKVFPNATIVVTHRDPVAVIQSTVTMLAYGQRMSRKQVDTTGLLDYWSDRIEHLLRACVRDRGMLPDAQSLDCPFDVFMADDFGMIEKIYAKAGVPMTEKARAELRGFIAAHPRGRHGQVIYDLKGDFGVDPDVLRGRFRFYFDRFPVKAETAA